MNNIFLVLHFTKAVCVGHLGLTNFFTFSNRADNRDGEMSFSLIFLLKLTRASGDIFCVNKGDALPLQLTHPAQITPLLLKATRV